MYGVTIFRVTPLAVLVSVSYLVQLQLCYGSIRYRYGSIRITITVPCFSYCCCMSVTVPSSNTPLPLHPILLLLWFHIPLRFPFRHACYSYMCNIGGAVCQIDLIIKYVTVSGHYRFAFLDCK